MDTGSWAQARNVDTKGGQRNIPDCSTREAPNDFRGWLISVLLALLRRVLMVRFCGSYSNIAGGFEAWGLKVLTGNHVWTFR